MHTGTASADCRGTRVHPGAGRSSGGGHPHHDQRGPPGRRARCLRRFGTWQVRAKRARVGRNPKTGTAAAIAARRVVRFVVSRTLKQAVAEVGSPAD